MGFILFSLMLAGGLSVISAMILITTRNNFPANQPVMITALDAALGLFLAFLAWGIDHGKGFYRKYLVGLFVIVLMELIIKWVCLILYLGKFGDYIFSLVPSSAFFILVTIYFCRRNVVQFLDHEDPAADGLEATTSQKSWKKPLGISIQIAGIALGVLFGAEKIGTSFYLPTLLFFGGLLGGGFLYRFGKK
ncbi:MAG TPA: hypothetical protein PLO78_09080 [Candidatus Omnitrophota bacterium]|nr:hypothetical protein [Candidatus Omnitrophota bacterium]